MTSRPRSHRHLAAQEQIGGHYIAVCGQFRIGVRLTDERDDVDCQHCLSTIAPGKVSGYSSAAFYRAGIRLRDLHAAEFRRFYEEELATERAARAAERAQMSHDPPD